MYPVDNKDTVVPLGEAPQSSVGAPQPIVLADEHTLVLAYYLEVDVPGWDGTFVRIIDPTTTADPVAVVRFKRYRAMMFGPPNDEAFSGHPLASRGLRPYRVFEVRDSSWLRSLERMNSVHPQHHPQLFEGLRHFVFVFHDSTFECIASEFELQQHAGPLHRVLDTMKDLLRR